jgi:hypothetical protein
MVKVGIFLSIAGLLIIGCSGGGEAVSDTNAKGTETATKVDPNAEKVGAGQPGTRGAKSNMAPGQGRTGGAPPPVDPTSGK